MQSPTQNIPHMHTHPLSVITALTHSMQQAGCVIRLTWKPKAEQLIHRNKTLQCQPKKASTLSGLVFVNLSGYD